MSEQDERILLTIDGKGRRAKREALDRLLAAERLEMFRAYPPHPDDCRCEFCKRAGCTR